MKGNRRKETIITASLVARHMHVIATWGSGDKRTSGAPRKLAKPNRNPRSHCGQKLVVDVVARAFSPALGVYRPLVEGTAYAKVLFSLRPDSRTEGNVGNGGSEGRRGPGAQYMALCKSFNSEEQL